MTNIAQHHHSCCDPGGRSPGTSGIAWPASINPSVGLYPDRLEQSEALNLRSHRRTVDGIAGGSLVALGEDQRATFRTRAMRHTGWAGLGLLSDSALSDVALSR